MTNDNGAEFENFSTQETFNLYKAGYAAGREEALAEVVPVIEFYSEPTNWTNADDKSYKFTQVGESDWNKSVAHGFVGGKRARELLQKIKG